MTLVWSAATWATGMARSCNDLVAGRTLVAASLDQSPPPYRAACQSFLPMFQAIAGLGAGVISGLLSARLGLPMTMEILLVFGMLSAIALLYVARRHYDEDYRRQGVLGEVTLDIN